MSGNHCFFIDMTCTSFPGPGVGHIYNFNPMKEFIHNYDDHMESAFDQFKKRHNREYADQLEHTKRKESFRQNLR